MIAQNELTHIWDIEIAQWEPGVNIGKERIGGNGFKHES